MTSNKPYKSIDEFADDFTVRIEGALPTTLEKVLDRAYDIRKFEIDLYWKRAGYFWGFLVASFTAYFIVSDTSKFPDKKYFELLVACMGFIFSLSWYFVNRGSKYWQSNWEKIIDTLEEKLKTPLYRVNLRNDKKVGQIFTRYPFSVSRINIIVSFYICCIWLGLIIKFFTNDENQLDFSKPFDFYILTIIGLTIFTTFNLFIKGQSKKDSTDTYYLEQRFSQYDFPEEPKPKE